jgi:hypothetical protein
VVRFHPFLFLLGLLDIFAGIIYYFNFYLIPIFLAIFIKGIWSLFSSIQSKDFLLLLLSSLDIVFSILAVLSIRIEILAFLMVAKGLISLF